VEYAREKYAHAGAKVDIRMAGEDFDVMQEEADILSPCGCPTPRRPTLGSLQTVDTVGPRYGGVITRASVAGIKARPLACRRSHPLCVLFRLTPLPPAGGLRFYL
jgi:hypothetical protein